MPSRSPLKVPPLRNPGQSLDEEIERLRNGTAMAYVLFAAAFCLLAFMEWYGYWFHTPRYPLWFTGGAVIAAVIAFFKVKGLRAQLRALRLGRDGERFVGQKLEELRSMGAHVLHDIPGDGFNIDHVVVSDRGIFAIETKTCSKKSSESRVTFSGEQILIDGHRPDRDPIKQARAESKWLGELLQKSTGKRFPVRAVVLFPNWWVEPAPESIRRHVWVLEPKAFAVFFRNEPTRLPPDLVTMAALHLSTHVHSKAVE